MVEKRNLVEVNEDKKVDNSVAYTLNSSYDDACII